PQPTALRCWTRAGRPRRRRTATTSMRTSAACASCSLSQRAARRRSRSSLAGCTASAGWPNRLPLRGLTSTKALAAPSRATMSISPSRHRQLRSRITHPSASSIAPAIRSPAAPTSSFAATGHHLREQRHTRGRPRDAPCPRSVEVPSPYVDRAAASGGQVELRLGQLLDVDVLERHHPHRADEPRGAVDVPHPGVPERELEEHLPAGAAHLQVDLVGEVEAPFGLHHVREEPDDVPVLAVQAELELGLVVLQVLCAHVSIMPRDRPPVPHGPARRAPWAPPRPPPPRPRGPRPRGRRRP